MPCFPHRKTQRPARQTGVAAVAAALLLGGCTSPAQPAAPEASTGLSADRDQGVVLRLAETNEYTSLNPLEHMFGITSKIYDGLYSVGPQGQMVPALATTAPQVDDTLTRWTVTIRDGVQFHDGTPLGADDVAATYRTLIDPDYGSPLAGTFQYLDTVTAVDDNTVEFTLTEAYAPFPSTLTVGIAPGEALGETIIDSPLNQEPIGSGPYMLERWRPGESLTLTATTTSESVPAVDQVVISFVPDENARVQRLLSGDFDGAQVSPRAAETLDAAPGPVSLFTNTTADYRGITLPDGIPALADPTVRYALNLAVDRRAMVDGVLHGHGSEIATPFTPAQGGAYDAEVTYPHDPSQAVRLLDTLGWVSGDDGVRRKDGQALEFDLMYFAEDTLRRDLAMAFASDLAEVGVTVTVQGVDRATAAANMNTKAFVFGGGDQPYDPDTQVYSLLHSQYAAYDPDSPYTNPSGYSNPHVDALLDVARTTADPEERDTIYRQVQQRLHDDPAMVALVVLDHTYAAAGLDNFDGVKHVFEPHEHGVAWGPWWNLDDWTVRP